MKTPTAVKLCCEVLGIRHGIVWAIRTEKRDVHDDGAEEDKVDQTHDIDKGNHNAS